MNTPHIEPLHDLRETNETWKAYRKWQTYPSSSFRSPQHHESYRSYEQTHRPVQRTPQMPQQPHTHRSVHSCVQFFTTTVRVPALVHLSCSIVEWKAAPTLRLRKKNIDHTGPCDWFIALSPSLWVYGEWMPLEHFVSCKNKFPISPRFPCYCCRQPASYPSFRSNQSFRVKGLSYFFFSPFPLHLLSFCVPRMRASR